MNELIIRPTNLPDTIEDLARFVLVGRKKYNSVRAEIRAIESLKLAEEVRNQKRAEAQMLAEAVLDAEVRLGELFKAIPHAPNNRGNQYTSGKGTPLSLCQKSKQETLEDLGFSKKQGQRLEALAENADIVEYVKAEARENNDFPTRKRVFQLVSQQKNNNDNVIDVDEINEDCREYDDYINLSMSVYKELAKIIELVDKFEITPRRIEALRNNFDDVLTVEDNVRYINDAIQKLNLIKMEMWKGKKYVKKL
jgi:hypothetical protein